MSETNYKIEQKGEREKADGVCCTHFSKKKLRATVHILSLTSKEKACFVKECGEIESETECVTMPYSAVMCHINK